jgi:hypothetical protein
VRSIPRKIRCHDICWPFRNLTAYVYTMDLAKAALKEHSKAQANKIIKWVGENQERFSMLVEAFIKGPYRVTQRLAWPLSYCVEYHPKLAKPHLNKLINALSVLNAPEAVKRNIVRLLQHAEIPSRYHGKIIEICFRFLSDPKQSIAVRVFAMSVLARLAEHHNEITKELRIIIEDQLPYSSPAFASRARKVFRQLGSNNSAPAVYL